MLFCKSERVGANPACLLLSGRGSAWLERLVRDQEVGGSNPLAPTTSKILPFISLRYLFRFACGGFLWTIVDQLKT